MPQETYPWIDTHFELPLSSFISNIWAKDGWSQRTSIYSIVIVVIRKLMLEIFNFSLFRLTVEIMQDPFFTLTHSDPQNQPSTRPNWKTV